MSATPQIGDELGGFVLERELGRGGMGVVYLARQTKLGRRVALKVITPALASDEDFRRRFEQEARMAASLDHPNVVPVFEADTTDGFLYLAMRYVQGTDLSTVIGRNGRLPPDQTVNVVGQVGAALDAAHSAGLVHRDVKPANVLLSGDRAEAHVYLTDFGLTKEISSASGPTHTGQWVGTVDYVAPEQLQGFATDARSDVYALGCVLYQCLSGQVPYSGTEIQKMWAHAHGDVPSLADANGGAARRFDPVVARALAKDPEERFPSAGDLGRAAAAATAGAQVAVPERSVATGAAAGGAPTVREGAGVPPTRRQPESGPTRPLPPSQAAPKRRLFGPLEVALLLLVIAGGVIAGALVARGSGDDPAPAREASQPAADPQQSSSEPANTEAPPSGSTTASLASFQTGADSGAKLPAAACETQAGQLYCWTPNDGFTIVLDETGARRVRADQSSNKARVPSQFKELPIGGKTARSGFVCISAASGLSCRAESGAGFDLPRYRGLPKYIPAR